MKFLHLADLHIGKRVNGFSMLEEQRYVLQQVLDMVAAEKPQAVLLAGDIYDKPQPAAEAVSLCDWFLTGLVGAGVTVLAIPGNHDSAERLAFAAGLLQSRGVYIARPFDGLPQSVGLTDEFGAVDFWLLPFLKPALVRACFPQDELPTYNDAVGRVMREVRPEPGRRNVLVMHQLITGAAVCDSEELAVGGLDNVDPGWFDAFDYVALGHLHSAQQVGRPNVRYAGSPVKYSFSEARQKKSAALVDMAADGAVSVRLLPLVPLHDLREVRGSFAEMMAAPPDEDYLHITLTDEEDVLEALPRLRQLYPNLMKLDYDNLRTREQRRVELAVAVTERTPLELFAEFYELQNNRQLSETQRALLVSLLDEIWEKGGGAR